MSQNRVKVSICIPAYKHTSLIARCLQSIQIQTFKDFEVIITDDSPHDEVKQLVDAYQAHFPISYTKNTIALGSPANWNKAVRLAKGDYIKIMHQDDWFATANSLSTFIQTLEQYPECKMVFAHSVDITESNQVIENRFEIPQKLAKWYKNSEYLLTNNFIGDPSTTLFRKNLSVEFDERMKWCVDTDFYMQQYLCNKNIRYIPEVLIHVGVHSNQITNIVKEDPYVIIKENILLLNKYNATLKLLHQFDFYWRLLRNFKVKNYQQLLVYAGGENIVFPLQVMIRMQQFIPSFLLEIGICSKLLMLVSFVIARLSSHK